MVPNTSLFFFSASLTIGTLSNSHRIFDPEKYGEYNSPEEVAEAIDRQIHLNYHLFDTNYLSYDVLEGGDRFKEFYSSLDKEEFLSRFAHLSEDVRNFVLNTYANPVRMMLQAKNEQ